MAVFLGSIASMFVPAWKHSDPEVALRALNKISDQNKLEEITMSAPIESVRLAACEKLEDEDAIMRVAFCSQDFDVASHSLHKLFRLPKTFPNELWLQTDFIYKLAQIPYEPTNVSTIAIRFEADYPGLCEAVIMVLKRRTVGKNVLTTYNSFEGSDTDEAKIALIKFLILYEARMICLRRPLFIEGASSWKRN